MLQTSTGTYEKSRTLQVQQHVLKNITYRSRSLIISLFTSTSTLLPDKRGDERKQTISYFHSVFLYLRILNCKISAKWVFIPISEIHGYFYLSWINHLRSAIHLNWSIIFQSCLFSSRNKSGLFYLAEVYCYFYNRFVSIRFNIVFRETSKIEIMILRTL